MLTLQITVKGNKEAMAKLRRVGFEFDNFSEELGSVSKYLNDFFSRAVFESEGGVYGTRWQALTPRYGYRKRVTFPGRGILERTGQMRRSFISNSSATVLRIGNKAPYFKYHQLGLGKMPARVMMRIDGDRKKKIVGLIHAGLDERIKRALAS